MDFAPWHHRLLTQDVARYAVNRGVRCHHQEGRELRVGLAVLNRRSVVITTELTKTADADAYITNWVNWYVDGEA